MPSKAQKLFRSLELIDAGGRIAKVHLAAHPMAWGQPHSQADTAARAMRASAARGVGNPNSVRARQD